MESVPVPEDLSVSGNVDTVQDLLAKRRDAVKNRMRYHLTETDCALLCTHGIDRYYKHGQVIAEEGHSIKTVYRIKSGRICLRKQGQKLYNLTQGFFIGEGLFIHNADEYDDFFGANLVANGPVTLTEVNIPFVRQLLEADKELAFKIYRHIAGKLSALLLSVLGAVAVEDYIPSPQSEHSSPSSVHSDSQVNSTVPSDTDWGGSASNVAGSSDNVAGSSDNVAISGSITWTPSSVAGTSDNVAISGSKTWTPSSVAGTPDNVVGTLGSVAGNPPGTIAASIAGTTGTVAGTPDTVAATPDAVAATPNTVAATPDTVVGTPGSIAGTPGSIAGTPGTVAGTLGSVTGSSDSVQREGSVSHIVLPEMQAPPQSIIMTEEMVKESSHRTVRKKLHRFTGKLKEKTPFKVYNLESGHLPVICQLTAHKIIIVTGTGIRSKRKIKYNRILHIDKTGQNTATIIYGVQARTLFFGNEEDLNEFFGIVRSLISAENKNMFHKVIAPFTLHTQAPDVVEELSPTPAPATEEQIASDKDVIHQLATRQDLKKGDIVVAEGDLYQRIYTVVSGELHMKKKGRHLVTLKDGEVFGVLTLFHLRPSMLDIEVASDTATLLIIPGYKITELVSTNFPLAVRMHKKAAQLIYTQVGQILKSRDEIVEKFSDASFIL